MWVRVNVHSRSGAGCSSNVVACSPCPLQKKKDTAVYLPLPSLLTNDVCRSDAQLCYWCQPLTHLVQEHGGYYTLEEGGKWLVMYVHFDFNYMLERIQNEAEHGYIS